MKKSIIFGMIAAAVCGMSAEAQAQKFAIKGYDNIALGKPLHVTNAAPGQSAKSSANSFGIDFGWKFWEKGANSLEANIGLGYSFTGATFSIPDMDYHYSAPAAADEDGNPYERYYQIRDLRQKSTVGYFTIPISIDYQYRCLKWLGVYAEAGFNFGFRVFNSTGDTSGSAYSYGIFPEYDDLLIDQSYLDDFGNRNLYGAAQGETKAKGFNCQVMCGAGFEFYAYKPVSFVVGVRYMAGLTQLFEGGSKLGSYADVTADSAPVTYTVADGTMVKSLAAYTSNSKLSPLSLHVGVNIRF